MQINANVTSVNASTSTVTLLSSSDNRMGVIICNYSTSPLYVKLGTGASLAVHSYRLAAYATLEFMRPVYGGIVTGIWEVANGNANITEIY